MSALRESFLRIILLFIAITVFSVQGYAQCDDIQTTITATDSPCGQNGAIKIVLSGAAVTGNGTEPPILTAIQYRAYLTGSDPKDVLFVDNNTLNGLAPGNYTVEIQGRCAASGGELIAKKLSSTVQIKQLNGWAALNMSASIDAQSLSCLASGIIRFYNFEGGTTSWKLEMISHPAEYTGSTILYNATTRPTTVTVKNLNTGTYKFRLTEGSACATTVEITLIVGSLSGLPTSMFTTTVTPQSTSTSTSCNSFKYTFSANTSDPFYYFITNAKDYFQYALDYSKTAPGNGSSLTWQDIPTNTSFAVTNLLYTASQMQLDSAKYFPRIYIRAKGCTEFRRYEVRLNKPTISASVVYSNCGDVTLSHATNTNANGVICYPVTWKVTRVSNGQILFQSSAPEASSLAHSLALIPEASAYTVSVSYTDAGGVTFNSSALTVKPTQTPVTKVTVPRYTYDCGNQEEVYIYISGATAKALKQVKFNKAEKYNRATSTWLIDETIKPNYPDIKISDYTITGSPSYIYPWAKTTSNIFYTAAPAATNYSTISSRANLVNKGVNDIYRFTFDVTDTCGVTRQITSGYDQYYYQHINKPNIKIERGCINNSIKFSISNIASLIKRYNRMTLSDSNTYVTSYVTVLQRPTGSTIKYTNATNSSYSYLNGVNDYVECDKAGQYIFAISQVSAYSSAANDDKGYCVSYVTVNVGELPLFAMDQSNTSAYRCRSSAAGQGTIEIRTKNGMGPYVFELYNQSKTKLLATNTDGKFSGWDTSDNSDTYRVVAYDHGCAPTRIVSFENIVSVYDLSNAPLANAVRKRVCIGDTISLRSLALGETLYQWSFNSPKWQWNATGRDQKIPAATLDMNGSFVVSVTVPGCNNEIMTGSVTMAVGEALMYWNPKATNGNWYDKSNWLNANGSSVTSIPAACTTVHIPGNAEHYPNLYYTSSPWDDYGYPSCDTIIYHYGGETTFPAYLGYNHAFVEYNFGYYDGDWSMTSAQPYYDKDSDSDTPYPNNTEVVPRLTRSTWNLVAAPLKYMTGGDFAMSGYPFFYQRLFNTSTPVTGVPAADDYTISFSAYNIDLRTTNNALALWAVDYDTWVGAENQKNLEGLQGILKVPYIYSRNEDKYRPLHKYNLADSISTFYYFNFNNLQVRWEQYDTFQRGKQSTRFVYETEDNGLQQIEDSPNVYYSIYQMPMMSPGSGDRIMIGNPMMCHINFDKLYAENSSVINNYYQITEAASGQTKTYRIGSPSNTLTTADIPALQGFIVSRRNPTLNENLSFYLTGPRSAVVTGVGDAALPKPRSSKDNSNQAYILASVTTPPYSEGASPITDQTSLLFNYPDYDDIRKTYNPDKLERRAEIFMIDEQGYTNTDQVENGTQPPLVKMGVLSYYTKDDLVMKIAPSGKLIKNVTLWDKVNSVSRDVTNGGEYQFQHRYNRQENGVYGLDTDRFYLTITYDNISTGMDTTDSYLSINYRNNLLSVATSGEITAVQITNLAGIVLLAEKPADGSRYEKMLDLAIGTYIVHVTLSDGQTQTQKIIVK